MLKIRSPAYGLLAQMKAYLDDFLNANDRNLDFFVK